jgi:hypothetical protein
MPADTATVAELTVSKRGGHFGASARGGFKNAGFD